jgi:hypothetical protein
MDTQEKQPVKNDGHNFEYLKYCHGKIDEIKASIYQRASILVVVMSFIILAWVEVVMGSLTNISHAIIIWKIILVLLCGAFLATFLLALRKGIGCLVPFENKSSLQKTLTSSKNNTGGTDDSDTDGKNVIVFTTFLYICDLKKHNFDRMVRELDSDNVTEQWISGIYDLSSITKRRYHDLFVACKYLQWNVIIFIIMFVFETVSTFV